MRRTDFGDGPGVRGDLCVFLSPPGPCGWGRGEPSRYADEGESGSGADGGESVRTRVGRLGDGGDSGMVCLLMWANSFNRPEARVFESSATCRPSIPIKVAYRHHFSCQTPSRE